MVWWHLNMLAAVLYNVVMIHFCHSYNAMLMRSEINLMELKKKHTCAVSDCFSWNFEYRWLDTRHTHALVFLHFIIIFLAFQDFENFPPKQVNADARGCKFLGALDPTTADPDQLVPQSPRWIHSRGQMGSDFPSPLRPTVSRGGPSGLTQSSTKLSLMFLGGDGDQAELCLVTRQLIQWYIP